MTITDKTRRYWLDTLRGWAEDRLSEPQFQECCAVLDECAEGRNCDETVVFNMVSEVANE